MADEGKNIMDEIVRITGLSRKELGNELFDQLVTIFPDGDVRLRHTTFVCVLPNDDARTIAIIEKLRAAGFEPWLDHSKARDPSFQYRLTLEKRYAPSDLVGAKYIQLAPPTDAYAYDSPARSPDDTMIIGEEYLPDGDFAVRGDMPHGFFVPTRVKRILESARFAGLRFLPTIFRARDEGSEITDDALRTRFGLPFWELDSDRRMPPLSPSLSLRDGLGHPLPRGTPGVSFIIDSPYINPQLRYLAKDLEALEPFDAARAFEGFNGTWNSPFIVSKRFYEYCTANGIRTGWRPVIIE